MYTTELDYLFTIGHQFQIEGSITEIEPYGDGHINTTYKVTAKEGYAASYYILQKVNTVVFKEPQRLMANIACVTRYLNETLEGKKSKERYEILTIVPTKDHEPYFIDGDGDFYRMYLFVDHSTGHTFTESTEILYEAGRAFGRFQSLLDQYPALDLYETIEDFHHTPKRYTNLMKAAEINVLGRVEEARTSIDICTRMSVYTDMIVNALKDQQIPYRVTHNDTKINNVLIDDRTGKGLCVIDLDTVMPGSSLYDYGDAIRSCGGAAKEDEVDLSMVYLDLDRFRAFTEGYLSGVEGSLTEKEIELMPYACIIMTLECGMRFLTDYLEGDKYFKIQYEQHNLDRARNQITLAEDMLDHLDAMKKIINDILEI